MKIAHIVLLGVVDAAATLLLKEGVRLAQENGVFDRLAASWQKRTNEWQENFAKYN